MERNVIFISHATPADDYFTTWLASKLKLLGYNVWVELDELKSGDAFWPEIERTIRNGTIKFLVVVSKNYVEKVKKPISGIFKELSCADRIDIKNFKSPVRLDETNEDLYPAQLMGLNSVDFCRNWQSGLNKLIESFEKEKIPKDTTKFNNPLNFWLDSFAIDDILTSGPERVYTNWFPFKMPLKLYIHRPIFKSRVDLVDIQHPYIEYSDRHLCFFPKQDYPAIIECNSSVELEVADILDVQVVPIDDFLSLNEPRKKIVELINKTFADFLFQQKLKKYEQSFGDVYYMKSAGEGRKRISLKHVGKTNVAIAGRFRENLWSFGVSSYAILYPFHYLKINSHIIFESPEFIPLDLDEQLKARRTLGSTWYNRDWLDKLIGFMLILSKRDQKGEITIPISSTESLSIANIPFSMEAQFGFKEPAAIRE